MKEPLFNQIAIRLDRQGMFDPVSYLQDLATLVLESGGEIYTHTPVDDFDGTVLHTPFGEVRAKYVIWATHTPIGVNPLLQSVVSPKLSFISVYRVNRTLPKALFWDTASPYRYFRPYKDDLLIVGGEDVATGEPHDPKAPFEGLEHYFESIGIESELSSWSAQLFEPIDHLPIIGHDPMHTNHFVATGLSGDGLSLGSFSGQALAGLIADELGWEERLYPFRPLRLKTFFSGDFYSHNLRVARHMVSDRFRSTGRNLDISLRRGEGAVVDNFGEKLAVYKDSMGHLKMFSAVCPHMKGIIQWNEEEKTFDCPCHGSRFSCTGEVIEGPSLKPLKPVETNEEPPLTPLTEPLIAGNLV